MSSALDRVADVTPAEREAAQSWLALHARSPLTALSYARTIARLVRDRRAPLRELTIADLQAFKLRLLQDELAPATINKHLAAIRSLYGHLFLMGVIDRDVSVMLRFERVDPGLDRRLLSEEEVLRMLDVCGRGEGQSAASARRERPVIELLYGAGLRRAELCSLQIADVHPAGDAGHLTIAGKGGQLRTIMLSARLWSTCRSLIRAGLEPEAPLFRTKLGTPYCGEYVRRLVHRVALRADLPQVSPHWLRHAHASHALARGAPLHVVRRTLGHRSLQTTSRYLDARPTDSSALYLPI